MWRRPLTWGHVSGSCDRVKRRGAGCRPSRPQTGVVAGAGAGNTVLPVVSGSAQQGQTLTSSTGTWSGSPTSYAYQWRRCNTSGGACVDIGSASASTYVAQAADVGSDPSRLHDRVECEGGAEPAGGLCGHAAVVTSSGGAPTTFGAVAAGASSAGPGAGYKFGSSYPLSVGGSATSFEFWARGGAASQSFTPAIYASSGSAPTSLVATGATVVVAANQPAGWVTSSLFLRPLWLLGATTSCLSRARPRTRRLSTSSPVWRPMASTTPTRPRCRRRRSGRRARSLGSGVFVSS